MSQNEPARRPRIPRSKAGKILLNLVITAILGAIYFYVSLPALNFQSSDFYVFIGLLCVIYFICALVTSGFHMENSGPREYFTFIKKQCLPVGVIFAAIIVIGIVGSILSAPIFRAGAYRELLDVETGDFATDVTEISFDEIPLLDEDSAKRLGTTQMGTLPDMVSQFEVSDDYTQINYLGRPVRVAPLEYADLIKWFTNRSNGLPAYIVVDMVTQEVQVVRLPEGQGMKYSPSEPLNRNISRHLRFHYPTFMFSTPTFEIDEEGNPWWICPRVVKRIGLFGGTDIQGAVMVNAVTVAMAFHAMLPTDEVPEKTDGYQGFFHLHAMSGDVTEAQLHYIIRDHDRDRFEARKALLHRCADAINAQYGPGTASAVTTDSYYNMKEKILPHMDLIHRAEDAFRKNDVTPLCVPIRGGTDGARLSWDGLPCPNLSTGGYNFHGVREWIPAASLDAMAAVLADLVSGFAQ